MQEPVLVLNATYEPINVTAVRRAMVLLLKGVAQAEELHNAEVHSSAHAHRVPSVIRLLAYRHIPQQSRALSRRSCCATAIRASSAGGCFPVRTDAGSCGTAFPGRAFLVGEPGGLLLNCNNSKGDRTPEEAGLKLARRPRPFTLHTSRQLMRLIGHRDERWRKYLFY